MKINTVLLFLLTLLAFQSNAQNNPAPGGDGDDFRTKMLKAVNGLRQKGTVCGGEKIPSVYKLTWNVQLESSAAAHANDMAQNNFFSHTSSNGNEVDVRISAAGYNWSAVGENIGMGYNEISEVMKGWRESPDHCKQLMSSEVTDIAIAQNGTYWVANFAKPMN
jgi:uncharacterized protein YkwD